jgi:hypothetical protein
MLSEEIFKSRKEELRTLKINKIATNSTDVCDFLFKMNEHYTENENTDVTLLIELCAILIKTNQNERKLLGKSNTKKLNFTKTGFNIDSRNIINKIRLKRTSR